MAENEEASLRGPLWAGPMLELSGLVSMLAPDASPEEVLLHHLPASLPELGTELLWDIPGDAIYFGGTDPGRFCAQLASDLALVDTNIVILTQNALALNSYMEAMRLRFGDRVELPDTNAVKACFEELVDDISVGRYRERHGEKHEWTEDGTLQVEGLIGVMHINGMIIKRIIDANPDRPVFIEESFIVSWMYPHVVPHGDILKFEREPKPLNAKTARAAVRRWKKRFAELEKTPEVGFAAYRRTMSKFAGAQASVLAHHGHTDLAVACYRSGIAFDPGNIELEQRLLTLFRDVGRYQEAKKELAGFANPAAKHLISWGQNLDKLIKVSEQLKTSEGQLAAAKNMPQVRRDMFYRSFLKYAIYLSDADRVEKYLGKVLTVTETPEEFEQLLEMIQDSALPIDAHTTCYGKIVNAYRRNHPTSVEARLEASYVALRKQDMETALAECEAALRLPGERENAIQRFTAEKERLRPLFGRKTPGQNRFEKLVESTESETH